MDSIAAAGLLTAEEASEALGVTRATLYAYVSRGLLRSEPAPEDHRARRYRGEDVARLLERREQRRHPERVAEGALRWGHPVLDSAITLISDGCLYYRGRNAVELARAGDLPAVVRLLWGTGDGGGSTVPPVRTGADAPPADAARGPGAVGPPGPDSAGGIRHDEAGDAALPTDSSEAPPPEAVRLRALDRFALALPLAAARDPAAWDLSREGVVRSGRRILRLFAELAGRADGDEACAGLSRIFEPSPVSDADRLSCAALILVADHELNVSTFTVRCVASAGSNPYAAVGAGLSALQGTRHGGLTERVEALLDEAPDAGVREWLAGRLRRGERPPGFGHRLYPDGDPRGRALLEWTAATWPDAPAVQRSGALAAAVEELLGLRPNIDYALTVLARALRLPRGSPLTLFGLGRTVGWIAHALEQYDDAPLIRPRARYTGVLPAG